MPALVTPRLVVTALCCAMTVSVDARATEEKRSYNLPPGDAVARLNQFAAASGKQVMFVSERVRGERTQAVSGEFLPEEALERMLAGTALKATRDPTTGVFVVTRRTPAEPEQEVGSNTQPTPHNPTMLSDKKRSSLRALMLLLVAPVLSGQSTSPAGAADLSAGELIMLDPFTVQTQRDTGYRASNSVSGTRTNVDLATVPLTIQVLTEELIQDIAAPDLDAVLQQAAGVFAGGTREFGDSFTLRGFDALFNLRNGFRSNGFTDSANYSRVEVVKGPNAVLYGISTPGGVINSITKRPLFTNGLTVQATAGNYEFSRGELDCNLVLGARKNAGFRLVSAYQENRAIEDNVGLRRSLVSPSFTWRLLPTVTVNLEFERLYQYENAPRGDGYPLVTELAPARPGIEPRIVARTVGREWSIVGPLSYARAVQEVFYGDVSWRIADWVTYRFSYNKSSYEYETRRRVNSANVLAGRAPVLRFQERDSPEWGYKNDFVFDFRAFGAGHRLLLAHEVRRFVADNYRIQNQNGRNIPIQPIPQEIVNRTPELKAIEARLRIGTPTLEDYTLGNLADYTSVINERGRNAGGSNSLAAADQVSLASGRLRLLGGVRWDEDIGNTRAAAGSASRRPTEEITYQAGALWQFHPTLGVYASRSTAFVPNSALDRSGVRLRPQVGTGTDAGIKFDLFDARLSGTLAAFELEREGIARGVTIQDNPATPQNEFEQYTVASGRERSRGIDFETIFNPLPTWQVKLSFAYLDTAVLSNVEDLGSIGSPVFGAPRLSGSLWSKHRFDSGRIKGLALGGGLLYYDRAQLESRSDRVRWQSDSYGLVSLFAAYDFRAWERRSSLQLNIDNAADREAFGRRGVGYVAPRTVKLTFRVEM